MSLASAHATSIGFPAARGQSPSINIRLSRKFRLPHVSPTTICCTSRAAGLTVRAVLTQAPPGTAQRLSVDLPTVDVQQNVTLTALRRRRGGTAVIVLEVKPGSAAEAAGVRPGQQLVGISDPVRMEEVWELNGLTSLNYVRQAISGRGLDTISLRLSAELAPEYLKAVAAVRGSLGDVGTLSADEAAEVAAELARMQEAAEARKAQAREKKLEAQKAFDEEVIDKDNNMAFFYATLGLFFGLPAVFLLVAFFTGYIDTSRVY